MSAIRLVSLVREIRFVKSRLTLKAGLQTLLITSLRFHIPLKDNRMSNPFAMPEFQSDTTPARTTMRLKRVGIFSSGLFVGAGGACLGLIFGGIVVLMALAGAGAAQNGPGANEVGIAIGMGVAAIFIAPILYGIVGFIAGVFYAFVYNLIAGMTGGLEMEFGRD